MTRYRRADRIACRRVNDEAVLLPVRSSVDDALAVHTLSRVGAFLWERLNQPSDLKELVDAVVGRYEVQADRAEKDITDFLEELLARALVVRE